MRTRFYIEKRKDASGNLISIARPVFMSVTFGGKRIITGTGVKVDISGWDPDLQRVLSSFPGFQQLNASLESMQQAAVKTMDVLEQSGEEINTTGFRQLFRQLKPKYSSGFFALFIEFMEHKSATWSSSTYRKIRSLYLLLREFEDQCEYPVSFHTLNAQFLERFVSFCSAKDYKPSTTYKAVNNLVWFLNWATREGFNVNLEYRQFYKLLDRPKENSRVPLFLQWDELMGLEEYTTDNRKKERVKELFCFMCFTGLRYTELQNLKKEDMKPGEVFVRNSGGGGRYIPLNKYAARIHDKYQNKFYLNNSAFPSLSIITMNKYLRLIGKDMELSRIVSSPSGKESQPLHQRLTAGIAVTTFIRNALELEVPVEIIARFTGVQNDSRVRRMISGLAEGEMKKFNG